jgi:hypothetical protein
MKKIKFSIFKSRRSPILYNNQNSKESIVSHVSNRMELMLSVSFALCVHAKIAHKKSAPSQPKNPRLCLGLSLPPMMKSMEVLKAPLLQVMETTFKKGKSVKYVRGNFKCISSGTKMSLLLNKRKKSLNLPIKNTKEKSRILK